ncbi:hypothetical protein CWE15_04110 [Aliidiomarina taiwanensis]|uniref:DUF3549 domain-containing protein n=1 Tax=Aliidiomarina taiwanensis TaxID=946228 RepID=A0A432XAM9_9GAMM|nr:DUF3549 family protein [Aliidiomarina taiwanensis]RUO44366.1 hypothetical protein CWE15_04110 [Aliidiomarina taiwanensis]
MTSIATLTEFLEASGVEWRVHDLSRRVTALSPELLRAVELGQRPFPTPRQQKAWLAITFWQTTPYIWFVALPLDERGAFQHAAMQHFMSIIVEALGETPTADVTESQEELLKQNPYIFQPDEARRAAFHAAISIQLEQPPSIHFEHAEAFFSGKSDIDWQLLGVQGIHDMAQRSLTAPAVQQFIYQGFLDFPEPLQEALCLALEQVALPSSLQSNLLTLRTKLSTVSQQQKLLRCVSARANEPSTRQWIRQLLQEPQGSQAEQQELYLIMAARCWAAFNDVELLTLYFTQVATLSTELFIQLYRELVAIAELRPFCLGLLYQADVQPVLQEAFTALKQSVARNKHV